MNRVATGRWGQDGLGGGVGIAFQRGGGLLRRPPFPVWGGDDSPRGGMVDFQEDEKGRNRGGEVMGNLMSMFMDAENRVEVRRQDALALLRSLDADSVDLVLTDPPYGISYQSNHRKAGKSAPIAGDWNFQFGPFLREVERVLVPGGAAYIFTRWDVFPLWHQSVNGVRNVCEEPDCVGKGQPLSR